MLILRFCHCSDEKFLQVPCVKAVSEHEVRSVTFWYVTLPSWTSLNIFGSPGHLGWPSSSVYSHQHWDPQLGYASCTKLRQRFKMIIYCDADRELTWQRLKFSWQVSTLPQLRCREKATSLLLAACPWVSTPREGNFDKVWSIKISYLNETREQCMDMLTMRKD